VACGCRGARPAAAELPWPGRVSCQAQGGGNPPTPALPHAPDSVAALKAQLAEIDATPKPFPETPDAYWAEYKAKLKVELKENWRNRDALRA